MYCRAERAVMYTYFDEYYERTGLFKREKRTRKKIFADTIGVEFCKSEEANDLIELKAKNFAAGLPSCIGYEFKLPNGMESEIKIYPWKNMRFGEAINELSLSEYLDVCKEYLNINND